MNVAIIIPAYRPTKALVELVETLHQHVASIVIVDDGNPPIYSSMFDQLKIKPVTILHHDLNRGKGAALKTAFQYILNDFSQYILELYIFDLQVVLFLFHKLLFLQHEL